MNTLNTLSHQPPHYFSDLLGGTEARLPLLKFQGEAPNPLAHGFHLLCYIIKLLKGNNEKVPKCRIHTRLLMLKIAMQQETFPRLAIDDVEHCILRHTVRFSLIGDFEVSVARYLRWSRVAFVVRMVFIIWMKFVVWMFFAVYVVFVVSMAFVDSMAFVV